jgi:seryl-tRNA synthetase
VTTRVELARAIPDDLIGEVRDKLAYASEALASYEIGEAGAYVDLTLADEARAGEVVAKVRRVIDGLVTGHREVDRHEIYRNAVTPPWQGPVWEALLSAGLVSPEGPGQVSLIGGAAIVAEALDARFAAMARADFGATLHQYPTMLSMEAMDRCHYFASFPHHVTFAPHLREDVESLEEVGRAPGHGEGYPFLAHLRPPRHVLSPAICFHTYLAFADRTIAGPQTVTARGRCFRYEAGNFTSLARLWDFTLREIVFVGPAPWVAARREQAIAACGRLVEELGLDAWIETANDPFFLGNAVARRYFQRVSRTKYELQLSLPSEGGPRPGSGSSIAAASFNLHGDFFGRSFGIGDPSGVASTACVGFGVERWTYALFAQLGPDVARWPERARRALGL